MKQTIAWHRQCLINSEAYLAREHELVARKIKELEDLERDVLFSRSQIVEAERRGLDSFDNAKFMHPAKRKGTSK